MIPIQNNRQDASAFVLLGLAVLATSGCASTQPTPVTAVDDSPPGEELVVSATSGAIVAERGIGPADVDGKHGESSDQCNPDEGMDEQGNQSQCIETEASNDALLDRTQRTVFKLANSTTRWFDRFFGESQLEDGEHVSRGRVTVSGIWDQRGGFDPRFNLRAKFALPALQNRARLIVGSGDSDDIVDGTTNEVAESLPIGFDDNRDDDWLLGLGYSRSRDTSRGLDLGVGIRISSSPDPYVNVTYRWHKTWSESWLLRVRPRAFWQRRRGTGITLDSDLDYAISPTLMLRWANIFAVEDMVDGLGWRTDIIAYQGLSNNRAFAYGVFAWGETAADVKLQNIGFELTYRRRVSREWFFIQLSTGVSWPRDFLVEQRESNVGVGISFEMQFGRW